MSDRQRPAPEFDWDKRRQYFCAATVSLLIHGAVLAALVYEATGEPVELLPTAMTIKLISMSPDPGGQANGGTPAGSAGSTRETSRQSEEQTPEDAAVRPVSSETLDQTQTLDHTQADDTALDTIVTDAGAVTTAAVPKPIPKPRKRKHPAKTEAPPPPPPPKPFPDRGPPDARPSPPNPAAGSTAQVTVASASTEAPAGHGGGSAGARRGPRFQLGAPGNPVPKYPARARRQGYEGRVVLAVLVSAEGAAITVRIASSSGYAVLDKAARRTVRRWRFKPALDSATKQLAQVTVPITFRLKDPDHER